MNKTEQAQQLRLAADIFETGHPFEIRHGTSEKWHPSRVTHPARAVLEGWHLRPTLATPPDGRPLHNPDNLTAEYVGVGWRLIVKGEPPHEAAEVWAHIEEAWQPRDCELVSKPYMCFNDSDCYRVPLSVPWPEVKPDPYAELKAAHAAGKKIEVQMPNGEWFDYNPDKPQWNLQPGCYRIKPDPYAELKAAHAEGKVIEVFVKDDEYGPDRWSQKENNSWTLPPEKYRIKPEPPPFQLPPPPPGMRWHREDGWKECDLPQGYRPLVEGELIQSGDEVRNKHLDNFRFVKASCSVGRNAGEAFPDQFARTTRPLIFTHEGKQWTWHKPGDPMPCDEGCVIRIIGIDGKAVARDGYQLIKRSARVNRWSETIGWRYVETKTVELGPEDVPPGSVFRCDSWQPHSFRMVVTLHKRGVCLGAGYGEGVVERSFEELLKAEYKINRSIPLTGKWDATAWEPCHKTLANG